MALAYRGPKLADPSKTLVGSRRRSKPLQHPQHKAEPPPGEAQKQARREPSSAQDKPGALSLVSICPAGTARGGGMQGQVREQGVVAATRRVRAERNLVPVRDSASCFELSLLETLPENL